MSIVGSVLLTLRWSARGETECRRDGYPPPIGCLHENPLGNSARCRVLLRHRVAVGPVNHARRNRQHAQISRNQSVGPGRVAPRAPVVVAEFEPRRSVASELTRVKIGGEVSRPVALVYRVDVLLEQVPRFYRVSPDRRRCSPSRIGRVRSTPEYNRQCGEPDGRKSHRCHTSLRKMSPQV